MASLDASRSFANCMDLVSRGGDENSLASALLDSLVSLSEATILWAKLRTTTDNHFRVVFGSPGRQQESIRDMAREPGFWSGASHESGRFWFQFSDGEGFLLNGEARGALPSRPIEILLSAALRTRLAVSIPKEMPTIADYEQLDWVEQTSLPARLDQLASQHHKLPGLRGLLIAALDSALDPLAAGGWAALASTPSGPMLELIARLQGRLPDTNCPVDGWPVDASLLSDIVPTKSGLVLRAWPMPGHGRREGFIVAALIRGTPQTTLRTLRRFARLCALVVRDAVRGIALNRLRDLRDLAAKLPESFEASSEGLTMVVDRVAEVFDAAAASLFLLPSPCAPRARLAATTDEGLRAKSEQGCVDYWPKQGLTGTILASGRSMRLVNALDPVEIKEKTGITDRRGPTHTEAAVDGNPMLQFLGVPVRQAHRTLGVLRLTRAAGREHFNAEDEVALRLFGDLLGTFLGNLGLAERFRHLWEDRTEALWLVEQDPLGDAAMRLVDVNPLAADLAGLQRGELLARPFLELLAPESSELLASAWTCGEEGPLRLEVLHHGGARSRVEIVMHPFSDGRFHPPLEMMLLVGRPISEREATLVEHQHLLDLLDDLKLIYFRTDAVGRRVRTSALEAEVTGYSEQELLGKSVEELYAEPQDRPRLVSEALKEQGAVRGQLLPLLRRLPEGQTRFWAEVDLRVYQSDEGDVIGAAGLYREVSHRIQLQEFLDATGLDRVASDAELLELVLKRDRANVDYLTSIGHQLKIPLGGLQGTLLNYKDGLLSGEVFARRLDYALGQINVCLDLVDNLGFMKRIVAGDPLNMTSRPVSLAQLTADLKRNHLHLLQDRKLYLYIDEPSLERFCSVPGDRDLLRQVIANLIHNAIKYSSEGTEIRVCGVVTAFGPAFQISNVGVPIPAEEREKIFERGFRNVFAAAVDPGGTGLGLWLCRRMLDRHQFHIRCDVETRQGETRNVFYIEFRPRPGRAR